MFASSDEEAIIFLGVGLQFRAERRVGNELPRYQF